MSALTKFFFRAPYALPRTGEIIRWWESRRLAYNLAVGAAGVVTIGAMTVAQLLFADRLETPPLALVAVYAILANLFYTLGPIADTLIMRFWGRDYAEVGPTLFRYGFVFAVGLTLLPVPMIILRIVLGTIFG